MDSKVPRKRFCFVYKTTNLANGKYYIGCHCTFKLDDGYLGSGMRLKRSIAKYGRESFKLEILEHFETREEALAREKELVTEELLKDPMCMNIQPGGGGGFNEKTRMKGSKVGRKRLDWLKKNDPIWWKTKRSELMSRENKRRHQSGVYNSRWPSSLGKRRSTETRRKMSEAHTGSRNSQFGKRWMSNEVESRRIAAKDIEFMKLQGWVLGRRHSLRSSNG